MLLIMNVFLTFSLLPDRDPGTGLDLIGDLLHFGKEGRTGGGVDPELPGGKVRTASSTSGSSFIFASILAEQLAQSIFSKL